MNPIPIPPHVIAARPSAEVVTVTRAPNMTDEECASAEMQHSLEETSPGRRFPHWYLHFTPTAREIALLVLGGSIELCLLGEKPPPSSVAIWPPDPAAHVGEASP